MGGRRSDREVYTVVSVLTVRGDPTTGIVRAYTEIETCSREITYAQGFSPFGMKINLLNALPAAANLQQL